jgi:hypothetical protein
MNLNFEKLHLHNYVLGTNDELEKEIKPFNNLKVLLMEDCIFRNPQGQFNQRVTQSQVCIKVKEVKAIKFHDIFVYF